MADAELPRKRGPLPPVYFLSAVLLMLVLDRYAPGFDFVRPPWRWAGIAGVIAGVVLTLAANRQFDRQGTTVKPHERSSTLITHGIYGRTRNPMYLGMVLILLGWWILLGSITPGIVILPFVVVLQVVFIRMEEVKLESTFGQSFTDYCLRVRRWL